MGRPVEYGAEVAAAARVVHEAAGGVGAKRLHPFVGELASRLAAFGELEMGPETEALLGRASASTLERLLSEAQAPMRRRAKSLTKPGTMLRNRIEVRTFRGWDDARPGFVEVDTVAHCGATTEGFHLWTVTGVDVATGWVEMDAVWARRRSGWGQRYGGCTGGFLSLCLDWTVTTGRIHKQGAVHLLRRQWDHLHQEQAVPEERQRPRGAEERSGGAAADWSRAVLVVGSLQAIEAGLLSGEASRELFSARPTAHREKC